MSEPDAWGVPDDFTVEDFDPANDEHAELVEAGGVCALINDGNEATADLSEVVPDGS